MSRLQQIFIAITFAGPVLLWLLSRRVRSPKLARGICTTIAAFLVAAYGTAFILKWRGEGLDIDATLPMHLCDWAAVATVLALAWRKQTAFELAYFWGLAGTSQALFTPAVSLECDLRSFTFLIVHSAIPAGVLWLMFEYRMRPRRTGVWLTLGWSQIYLAAALTVNHFANANYGFLSARPGKPSMLDYLPDNRVLYVLGIDALALLFFTVLQLPWWVFAGAAARRFESAVTQGKAVWLTSVEYDATTRELIVGLTSDPEHSETRRIIRFIGVRSVENDWNDQDATSMEGLLGAREDVVGSGTRYILVTDQREITIHAGETVRIDDLG